MAQTKPTRTRYAQETNQQMADARALEAIVARTQAAGRVMESDKPMLLGIARRMPANIKAALRPVFAELGEEI
jgi:hypothetical protein